MTDRHKAICGDLLARELFEIGAIQHRGDRLAIFEWLRPTRISKSISANGAGRKCYEVYKNSSRALRELPGADDLRRRAGPGFRRNRASTVTGGNATTWSTWRRFKDSQGRVQYVLEMTSDLTESRHWQREYDLLFERVPCYVLVIDRNSA